MSFNPRWIVGKTIAAVDMRPRPAGDGRGVSHSPRITFTDGSEIEFRTEETESGNYGTEITYWPRKP